MRILFLGDVIGRGGRDAVCEALPGLRDRLKLDLVIVNGENASHGFGLAPDMAEYETRLIAVTVTAAVRPGTASGMSAPNTICRFFAPMA